LRRPGLANTLLRWYLTVRGDEQPGHDLRVGQAIAGQPRHLGLLRGQRLTGPRGPGSRDSALAGSLTGSRQLRASPLREPPSPYPPACHWRCTAAPASMRRRSRSGHARTAGVTALARHGPGPAQLLDRLPGEPASDLAITDQRPHPGLDPQRPLRASHPSPLTTRPAPPAQPPRRRSWPLPRPAPPRPGVTSTEAAKSPAPGHSPTSLTTGAVESPLRGGVHGEFGERPGKTDREQSRTRAPCRLNHWVVDSSRLQPPEARAGGDSGVDAVPRPGCAWLSPVSVPPARLITGARCALWPCGRAGC
jgi:hypothetical protein